MTKPKIHILIVEDDLVDRMACRRALSQDTNYEFVLYESESGHEGLQLIQENKTDCILLDYNLPDMNGLEFFAELRKEQGEIPLPVIMLTGADNTSVAVEAMKSGVQDYLVKDVSREYLKLLPTVIQRVVRERQALEELNLHRSRMEDMVSKRTTKFENRSAILESANANLASKLEECTQSGMALKKCNHQLTEMFNNAPCCYYTLDPDMVFSQTNDASLECFGRTREELVGKLKLTDLLTSASKEIFLSSYLQLNGKDLVRNLELDILCKNGSTLTMLLNANAVKDSGGRLIMSRYVMFDVTKQ